MQGHQRCVPRGGGWVGKKVRPIVAFDDQNNQDWHICQGNKYPVLPAKAFYG